MRPRILLIAHALALTLACSGRGVETLRIATTTSVDNSGLLDAIVPAFEQEARVDLQVVAVGSGQAFQLGRRGDVALLLTHEPLGERALLNDGLVRYYRKVMFNRFVIAGPAADQAAIAQAATAADAMSRIAKSGQVFVSRGDESGTHVREKQLWTAAGVRPEPAKLIETGQGMAPTLRVAAQRNGYVLTDEATFARLSAAVNLKVLFTGDPVLLNTYAVSRLSTAPAASTALADRFARWIAEGAGQDRIEGFSINGQRVFFRWPAGIDHGTPEAMPRGAR